MSAIITPFEGTEPFNTASFNNRISQINTGFSYVSNPNLLDNWYFGRPVNQRGQTEYTSNVYTVDRWWVEHGITLKIANDGVVLESAGTDWWVGLLEKIECSLPARTTITFSVLGKFTGDTRLFLGTSSNDELKSNYFTPSGDWECVSVTATLESATNMLGVRVSPDTGNVKANCTLLAAKLELGPTQTLAHLEGDKWILNEVPDYGEQLRRCQRYFRRRNTKKTYGTVGIGTCTSDTLAQINIPRTPMRAQPSVSVSGTYRLYAYAGTYFTPTEIKVDQISDFYIRLNCTISGGTPGQSLYMQSKNDTSAYIDEIADL